MNPIAVELNNKIKNNNPEIMDMLSELGEKLFFPKGILSQSAEAKKYAHKYNATIGIAKEKGNAMYLPELMNYFKNLGIDEITPYAPSYGVPELRELWKQKIYEKNPGLNKDYNISLPIVTNGITHGLSIIGDMFINEGDTILLPDKIWGNYRLTFIVRKKAEIENFKFFDINKKFNIKDFKDKLNSLKNKTNKVVILLNFPNNPIGYTPLKEEAQQIAQVLTETASDDFKIVAVFDDAYFGLYYEEEVFTESIFGLVAGKNKNLLSVKLDGATKEDYVWGFRTGFITYGVSTENNSNDTYDALEKKTGGCIRGNISNCSKVAQSVMIKLLKSKHYNEQKQQKYQILKKRANKVKQVLLEKDFSDVWEMYPFNSGYFMCLKFKNIDTEELRQLLLKDYGIGVISPNPTDLRIAFSSLELDDIEDMFNKIYEAAKKLI